MLLTEGLAAFSVRQGEVEAVAAWCRFKVMVAACLSGVLSMQTFMASLTWVSGDGVTGESGITRKKAEQHWLIGGSRASVKQKRRKAGGPG
jgi:hypothetical protein